MTGSHPGGESLPDAGIAHGPQRNGAGLPVVPVSHDVDALGIGCPDREASSGSVTVPGRVRTQLLVQLGVRPFGQEMKVGLSQDPAIGLTAATGLAAIIVVTHGLAIGVTAPGAPGPRNGISIQSGRLLIS